MPLWARMAQVRSTLSSVLVGNPALSDKKEAISFYGKRSDANSVRKTAVTKELFLSFQYPVEIRGVSMVNLCVRQLMNSANTEINFPFCQRVSQTSCVTSEQ